MNTDAYKNTDPYPTKPEKPVFPGRHATAEEFRRFADALDSYEPNMVAFRIAQSDWHHKEGELQAQFKRDALREVGLEGHPKADLVYRKAWEHGHANGLSDVFYWLQELAEVVL